MVITLWYRAKTTGEGFCQAGKLGQLFQYMREYNAESPKRFNSQGRRNTFPIWLYNLSMTSEFENKCHGKTLLKAGSDQKKGQGPQT